MSREIKFRAWKMHNGKMRRCVYTPLSYMGYVQKHLDEPVMKHSDVDENDVRDFMPDADIIEQDTGFKDRHGKKIWEGDIVRQYGLYIYEVKQHKSGAWIIGIDHLYGTAQNCEVIGNIHDNPELLGVENE